MSQTEACVRSLVSAFQTIGFIPYFIKPNPKNQYSLEFSFSYKSFSAWWFFTSFTVQIAVPLYLRKITQEVFDEHFLNEKIPTTLQILGPLSVFSSFLLFLLARWFVFFRYRQLKNIVEKIQKIEQLFMTAGEQNRSAFLKRFLIGFILLILVNIGMVAVAGMGPLRSMLRKIGMGPSFWFTIMQIQIFSLVDCPILSLHLSLYVISCYIRKLYTRIKTNHKVGKIADTYQSKHGIQCLEESIDIFARLCHSNTEINSTFSTYTLLALMIKFVALIGNFFAITFGFISCDAALNNSTIYMVYMVVVEWFRIIVILLSADMPSREIRRLREGVLSLVNCGYDKPLAEKNLLIDFLGQIDEERFRLSAGGFFTVGLHLLPPLLGAITTYLVVLVQN